MIGHDRPCDAIAILTVRPGELLWLGPPSFAGLGLDPSTRRDLLLVAGGTGLAPLRPRSSRSPPRPTAGG
ncbi:hypothetical protein V6V16_01360 [Micromonospora sp. CPCC 205561]